MRTLGQIVRISAVVLTIAQPLRAQVTSWQWLNPLPQGNSLSKVQMLDASNIVAVGLGGAVIRSTDGGADWLVADNVNGVKAFENLSFTDANTGTVVGTDGSILRTTDGGITWTSQLSGTNEILHGVSFPNATTGTAVGFNGTILHTTNGGTTWSPQSSGTGAWLTAVSFTDANTGTVVARGGTILRTTNGGGTWTPQVSGTGQHLLDVFFINANTGTTVGSNGTILHTTDGGATWVPQTSGTGSWLWGVTMSDANTAVATGDDGTILRTTDGGASWVPQTSGSAQFLLGVSYTDANTGTVVGGGGTIFRTTNGGAAWSSQTSGPTNWLFDISFASADIGTAVGERGTILRSTTGGATWISQASGILDDLLGVSFLDVNTGTAVGAGGAIVRTTNGGTTWTPQTSGTSNDLLGVSFTDANTGTTVGTGGTILRTTDAGTTWNSQTSGTLNDLVKVSFTDASTGTVVGIGGTILRTTDGGATWASQTSGTFNDLYAVSFTSTSTGTAVGLAGTVLRTTDSGTTWTSQTSGVSEDLYGVTFASFNTGVAVGFSGSTAAIIRTTNGGATWTKWTIPTGNPLSGISLTPTNATGFRSIAVGFGGTIICSAFSPLNLKTWTGTVDSSWNVAGNWSPAGVPTPGDSVVIPSVATPPVVIATQQQITVASLNIVSGAKLTITDALRRFVVKSDVRIDGTLEVRPPATTSIVVGGNWIIGGGPALRKSMLVSDDGFLPAKSTVYFKGEGTFEKNFYNLVLDTASAMSTSGNVNVANQCAVLQTVVLRPVDTLSLSSADPQALTGKGVVSDGTVKRAILPASTDRYRFDSDSTYLRFNGAGTYPSVVSVTSFPGAQASSSPSGWTAVPSHIDSSSNTIVADSIAHLTKWAIGIPHLTSLGGPMPSIERFYEITQIGGSDWQARLSMHYDQSEVPAGLDEDSLVILTNDLAYGIVDLVSQKSGGWELVSVPVIVGDYRKSSVYPTAVSPAFSYVGSYQLRDTLKNGTGYWVRLPGSSTIHSVGNLLYRDTIAVQSGWNIIGSVSVPIPVSSITSIPPGLVTTQFFGYEGAYQNADTIRPGDAYWVKVSASGRIILSLPVLGESVSRITIRPTIETPPPPPDGAGSSLDQTPNAFALDQNYPNPFNPSTTIRYQLPVASQVSLKVYNALGQVVGVLVDEVQDAGYKSVEWNTRSVASGVYLCRLVAGGFVETRKLVLLR